MCSGDWEDAKTEVWSGVRRWPDRENMALLDNSVMGKAQNVVQRTVECS